MGIRRQPSGEKSTSAAATGMHKFDIRQSVNDWSQGIAKNYGLMLMAVNEGDKGSVFYGGPGRL